MKDTAYIVISKSGIEKLYKTEPSLKPGQRALKIALDCEDEYFKQSIPEAALQLGPDHIMHPRIEWTLELPTTNDKEDQ